MCVFFAWHIQRPVFGPRRLPRNRALVLLPGLLVDRIIFHSLKQVADWRCLIAGENVEFDAVCGSVQRELIKFEGFESTGIKYGDSQQGMNY